MLVDQVINKKYKNIVFDKVKPIELSGKRHEVFIAGIANKSNKHILAFIVGASGAKYEDKTTLPNEYKSFYVKTYPTSSYMADAVKEFLLPNQKINFQSLTSKNVYNNLEDCDLIEIGSTKKDVYKTYIIDDKNLQSCKINLYTGEILDQLPSFSNRESLPSRYNLFSGIESDNFAILK